MASIACGPAAGERPKEGAAPASGPASKVIEAAPPTLAPAPALRITPITTPAATVGPSPVARVTAAASPSVAGVYPIISNIAPPQNATVSRGAVTVGARVSGSSNIADVSLFIDGEAMAVEMASPDPKVVTVSVVRELPIGSHDVRIQARDEQGLVGGYRWQFNVGSPSTPTTGPTAAPPPRPAPPTATRPPAASPPAKPTTR
ncbi:MAG: Ig-like domain-containing protein [Chloroflexota bacterium]